MNTTRRSIGNTERRRSRRYLPPRDLRLALKKPGLLSFLGGDLLHACLNVSEGGLRVVLKKEVAVGDLLRARLDPGRGAEPLELLLRVQYAVPSGEHRGRWESGLRFECLTSPARATLSAALIARSTPADKTTRRLQKEDAWGGGR